MEGRNLLPLGAGVLASALAVFSFTELYLRFFPPQDVHPFLGDQSPLAGHYVPDPDFVVGFRSWNDLCGENPKSLGNGRDEKLRKRAEQTWLVFGNSFAFEYATWHRKQGRAVHVQPLDHREALTVRLAQIKAILEHGIRPQRIVLVLTPVDFKELGEEPLCCHQVNAHGGRVFLPWLPAGPAGWLVENSRLALTAWVRTGRHRGNPAFSRRALSRRVPESMRQDLDRLFANLGRLCSAHEVPITVVLIPMRSEVTARRGFALEDALVSTLQQSGIGVVDPRSFFLDHPNVAELYIPDGHLSEKGNQLLDAAIHFHLQRDLAARQNQKGAPRP
jgi:hypothetical protein